MAVVLPLNKLTEEQKAVVDSHYKLAMKHVSSHIKAYPSLYQEIEDAAVLALIKAVERYDKERAHEWSLQSYIIYCVRLAGNDAIDKLNYRNKKLPPEPGEDATDYVIQPQDYDPDLETLEEFEKLIAPLDDHLREVARLLYVMDFLDVEVAEHYGVCRETVRLWRERIFKELRPLWERYDGEYLPCSKAGKSRAFKGRKRPHGRPVPTNSHPVQVSLHSVGHKICSN